MSIEHAYLIRCDACGQQAAGLWPTHGDAVAAAMHSAAWRVQLTAAADVAGALLCSTCAERAQVAS